MRERWGAEEGKKNGATPKGPQQRPEDPETQKMAQSIKKVKARRGQVKIGGGGRAEKPRTMHGMKTHTESHGGEDTESKVTARDSGKTGLETDCRAHAEKHRPGHSRKKPKEMQGVPGRGRHWKGLSAEQRCVMRDEAEMARDAKSKAETWTMWGGGRWNRGRTQKKNGREMMGWDDSRT